jgi:hypothetical protein
MINLIPRIGIALIIACLIIGAVPSFPQTPEKPDPLKIFDEHKRWYTGPDSEAWFNFFGIPEDEVRKSIEYWEAVGKDLADLDGSLTKGRYYSGGHTHSSFLRWSKGKGFIWLHVDHCQGGPMRILRGRVEMEPEGVVLIPEITLGISSGHDGHGNYSSQPKQFRMLAIKWMGSLYLVQKENLADFADFSAGLGDYNGNYRFDLGEPFLVMGTDAETGSRKYTAPVYPRGYERFHRPPFRGSIIAIAKGRRQVDAESDIHDRLVTTIKIKLENAAGPASPIRLLPVGQELGFVEEFELKSIKGNVATVEHSRLIARRNCVVSSSEDCKDPDHLKLRIGIVLSSNGL